MTNHSSLLKRFAYGRTTLKYLYILLVTLLITIIPVLIFLNPFWKKIQSLQNNPNGMSFLLWFNNLMGFFFGIFFLISVSSHVHKYLKLD
jgi:membrane protease YdiL (CAAX protease family)